MLHRRPHHHLPLGEMTANHRPIKCKKKCCSVRESNPLYVANRANHASERMGRLDRSDSTAEQKTDTCKQTCVVFRCVSEVIRGPVNPFPIFPIPDFSATLKCPTPKRPATHL
uniref:SFRICE_024856 n=1 Tax=Spodoptera frugiperda TaxID=7108 RepID=A0A2H1WU20_SPOFR